VQTIECATAYLSENSENKFLLSNVFENKETIGIKVYALRQDEVAQGIKTEEE
jgi:hypothetical protein